LRALAARFFLRAAGSPLCVAWLSMSKLTRTLLDLVVRVRRSAAMMVREMGCRRKAGRGD
jgi:hypothetical protein